MFKSKSKITWLAWEKHRRTEELSRFMGCDCFMFTSKKPRLFKVPFFMIKTIWLLITNRIDILIIQCPSVILGCFAGLLKPIFRYKLVVDAHNAAVDPDEFYFKWARFLYIFCQKVSDLIVITNKELKKYIIDERKIVYLPDTLPSLTCTDKKHLTTKYNLVYICTFSDDEPYLELFKAAKLLDDLDITIYVTGNYSRIKEKLHNIHIPSNVKLTGFLSELDYAALLSSVDIGIVLTSREGCLTCGAYELISMDKPMVLSGTTAIKNYFNFSAIYCLNNSQGIAFSIRESIEKLAVLKEQIPVGKDKLVQQWDKTFDTFTSQIGKI